MAGSVTHVSETEVYDLADESIICLGSRYTNDDPELEAVDGPPQLIPRVEQRAPYRRNAVKWALTLACPQEAEEHPIYVTYGENDLNYVKDHLLTCAGGRGQVEKWAVSREKHGTTGIVFFTSMFLF